MRKLKICISILLVFVFTLQASIFTFAAVPGLDDSVKYWDTRHTFAEMETLFNELASNYPNLVTKYSIGHSWQERNLWCLEMTSPEGTKTDKIPLAIIGNIHGGEQESGESSAYMAWWLATNYGVSEDATKVLDEYLIYIIPIMNPDGYAQSFVYPTRQNLRPTDRNGIGGPFSDPYTDLNNDGFIGKLYKGTDDQTPPEAIDTNYLGMESPDWDKNGIAGDDPRMSTIDMNRTFDHMWNRYDIDGNPVLGTNSWAGAGPGAATEPEVQAVQNFLIKHPVYALITAHTGIQCVLWSWCYTPEKPKDSDFFEKVGTEMAKAFSDTVTPVRGENAGYYAMQSYNDYPTSAELIDWAYGRLGIHAYTVEVYAGGTKEDSWQNTLPEEKWVYIGSVPNLNQEHVWSLVEPRAQMVGIAPPDQHIMVEGFKNAALVMIYSEPHGNGPVVPDYLK